MAGPVEVLAETAEVRRNRGAGVSPVDDAKAPWPSPAD